jgi:D-glycero-D-manno-heptose 1,7-bisphosphate phosphatase
MNPAIFLDKDGTLVDDVPYNVDPGQIRLTKNAGAGLQLMRDAGYRLFIVSNQSGVARGRFAEAALEGVWRRIAQLLAPWAVAIDGVYWCPHHPEGKLAEYAIACDCRKPQPGMLLRAASEHGIDLSRSWMVGDILHDVEAGRRAGCGTVLIDNGNETEWQISPQRMPDLVAPDLLAAAQAICGEQRRRA